MVLHNCYFTSRFQVGTLRINTETLTKQIFVRLLPALLVFHIWFGFIPGWKKITSDFPNYLVASKMLVDQKSMVDLYNKTNFQKQIDNYGFKVHGLFIMYPPATAFVMLPLVTFSPLTAKRIWLIFNTILLFVIGFFISGIYSLSPVYSLSILLLNGFNLTNDLMLGQVYVLMLLLFLSGLLAHQKGKEVHAGILWGLLAAIKYFPLLLIPLLLLNRNFKTTFILLFTFAIFQFLSIVVLGVDTYQQYMIQVMDNYGSSKVAGAFPLSFSYQSVTVFLNNLSAPYSVKLFFSLLIISNLIFIFYKFYKSKYFLSVGMAATLLSILILEVGSASYHLIFCTLTFLLLNNIQETKGKGALLISFILLGFLPTIMSKIPLDNLFWNFGRLWCLLSFGICSFISIYSLREKQVIT